MRMKAFIRIRNDVMITARKHLGLSQLDLGILSGVPIRSIICLEAMRYKDVGAQLLIHAQKISVALNIEITDVIPLNSEAFNCKTNIEFVREVPIENIIDFQESLALEYKDPSIAMEDKERLEILDRSIEERLTEREKIILVHHWGLRGTKPETLGKIGERVGVTRERVRQILMKAERKLSGTVPVATGSPIPEPSAIAEYMKEDEAFK